jgi:heme b synthase
MKDSGIERVSISIDGPEARSHNLFRGVPGAFEASMQGIEALKQGGLEFQINTTVTRNNLNQFQDIFDLAEKLGAVAWHIFLLVPTGRGDQIREEVISAEEYEEVLNWFYDFRKTTSMHLKATCAPHYHRILRQRAKEEGVPVDFAHFGLDAVSRGCLGGIGFCFISHSGQVQPCGYLELDCGQVREQPFPDIWANSEHFQKLRDQKAYVGKCGRCEYHKVCGGCRARALTMNGDYLAEEPLCTYEPKKISG